MVIQSISYSTFITGSQENDFVTFYMLQSTYVLELIGSKPSRNMESALL